MIWIGVAVAIGIGAILALSAFRRWRAERRFSAQLAEAAERHARETAQLPDGHRPLSEKEKSDAINRVRLAARKSR